MKKPKKNAIAAPQTNAAEPPEPWTPPNIPTAPPPGWKPGDIRFDWMQDDQIDASDPQEPGEIIKSMHHWQREANRLGAENLQLKSQLAKSLGLVDDRTPEESEAAQQIKSEVVQALRDMLPQAKRAAKRGKPALLRLIVRTIRTKL